MKNVYHTKVFICVKNDDDTYSVIPNPEINNWNDYPRALERYRQRSPQGLSYAEKRYTKNSARNVVLSLNSVFGNKRLRQVDA